MGRSIVTYEGGGTEQEDVSPAYREPDSGYKHIESASVDVGHLHTFDYLNAA